MARALRAAFPVGGPTVKLAASAPLILVPLLLFAFIIHRTVLIGPLFAGLDGFDYDPAYVYLLSGLSLADLTGPRHVDHPGIATQLLMAIYLRIAYWIDNAIRGEGRTLYQFVAAQPEQVLLGFGYLCTAIFCLINAAIGLRVYQATRRYVLAIATQATFLLIANQLVRLGIVNGETTGLIFGAALFHTMIPSWLAREERRGTLPSIQMGLCCAGMVASKVTFAPLVLLLFAQTSVRSLPSAVGAFVAALALLVLPIVDELDRYAGWLNSVLWHTGKYGRGEQGFVDLPQSLASIERIADLYPSSLVVFAAAILLAGLSMLAPRWLRSLWPYTLVNQRFLWSALAASFLQALMVIKHFDDHYYVPSLLLAAMLLAFFLLSLAHADSGRPRGHSRIAHGAALALFAGTVALSLSAIATEQRALLGAKSAQQTYLAAWNTVRARYRDATWISVFRVKSPIAAQAFALGYVEPEVAARYRSSAKDSLVSFNRWNRKFLTASGWKNEPFVEALAAKGETVLIHAPADFDISLIDLPIVKVHDLPDGSSIFDVRDSRSER